MQSALRGSITLHASSRHLRLAKLTAKPRNLSTPCSATPQNRAAGKRGDVASGPRNDTQGTPKWLTGAAMIGGAIGAIVSAVALVWQLTVFMGLSKDFRKLDAHVATDFTATGFTELKADIREVKADIRQLNQRVDKVLELLAQQKK